MPTQDDESDDRHRQSPVQIRIPEALKKEWKKAVDEQYGSYKNLITTAVNRELSDEYVQIEAAKKIESNVDIDVSGIDTEMNELQSEIQAIGTQLDDLYREMNSDSSEELTKNELMKLGMRVQDVLISVPSKKDMRNIKIEPGMTTARERVKISGYPEDIADYLGEDEYHVRKALIWLEAEETAPVHSFIQEGRRRFFELDTRLNDIEYGSDWEPPEDWDPFSIEDN